MKANSLAENGALHLDLFDGAEACGLCGALVTLGAKVQKVARAFSDLGLKGVHPVATSQAGPISFYFLNDEGQQLFQENQRDALVSERAKSSTRQPRVYRRHRKADTEVLTPLKGSTFDLRSPEDPPVLAPVSKAAASSDRETKTAEVPPTFGVTFQRWLGHVSVDPEVLEQIPFEKLDPIPAALARKLFQQLVRAHRETVEREGLNPRWSGREVAAALLEGLAYVLLLSDLDPWAITASSIPLMMGRSASFDEIRWHPGYLTTLAEGMPSWEVDTNIPPSDAVGLAALKISVFRFGARPPGIISQRGLGLGRAGQGATRALIYRPKSPQDQAHQNDGLFIQPSPAVHLTAFLAPLGELETLFADLKPLGAEGLMVTQVMREGRTPAIQLEAILPQASADRAAQLLLAQGGAQAVLRAECLLEKAAQREVVVPVGRGPKAKNCRVIERIYGGKVLSAEPHPADLQGLVQVTGQARTGLRQDVLDSWQRWCQREDPDTENELSSEKDASLSSNEPRGEE